MGLDMYLVKTADEQKFEEVAYWRKANQIRGWFAEHLEGFEDNQRTEVSKQELAELVDLCKKVLKDHRYTKKLPPTSGFFFGSSDVDDYYFAKIEDTIGMVQRVIDETDWDTEKVYYDEWY